VPKSIIIILLGLLIVNSKLGKSLGLIFNLGLKLSNLESVEANIKPLSISYHLSFALLGLVLFSTII